jgi:hypothetical protein
MREAGDELVDKLLDLRREVDNTNVNFNDSS